jgi:RNA polymerase sigma-70 factor (ECF subfamily)
MSAGKEGAPAARAATDDGRGSVLEQFARQYAQVLTRFFNRRVENRSDVADLVQDVFLRLSRLDNLGEIEKPEQYLFTTAASALRDKRRREAVREQHAHQPFDESTDGRSDFAPDRVLAGREAVDRLRSAIRELPERTRDVFVLRALEELKMAEIARVLGISQRAVEKHYAKALAHVAARLKDHRDG